MPTNSIVRQLNYHYFSLYVQLVLVPNRIAFFTLEDCPTPLHPSNRYQSPRAGRAHMSNILSLSFPESCPPLLCLVATPPKSTTYMLLQYSYVRGSCHHKNTMYDVLSWGLAVVHYGQRNIRTPHTVIGMSHDMATEHDKAVRNGSDFCFSVGCLWLCLTTHTRWVLLTT